MHIQPRACLTIPLILLADVCADLLLVLTPIRIFATSSLMRAQRVRLIAVFSATLATTVASLVHGVLVLQGGGIREGVAATAEVDFAHASAVLARSDPTYTRRAFL